jgi:hypothetical protein
MRNKKPAVALQRLQDAFGGQWAGKRVLSPQAERLGQSQYEIRRRYTKIHQR